MADIGRLKSINSFSIKEGGGERRGFKPDGLTSGPKFAGLGTGPRTFGSMQGGEDGYVALKSSPKSSSTKK